MNQVAGSILTFLLIACAIVKTNLVADPKAKPVCRYTTRSILLANHLKPAGLLFFKTNIFTRERLKIKPTPQHLSVCVCVFVGGGKMEVALHCNWVAWRHLNWGQGRCTEPYPHKWTAWRHLNCILNWKTGLSWDCGTFCFGPLYPMDGNNCLLLILWVASNADRCLYEMPLIVWAEQVMISPFASSKPWS